MAFSPDGKLIVSGSNDNTVRLWDATTGTARQTLEGHSGAVYSVAFSPDGELVVSGSYDKTMRLWDAMTGTARQTLEGHSGAVSSMALSPDGKLIVSGSSSSSSSLFNVWWATRSVAATTPPEGYKDVERLYYSLIIYTRPRYYPFYPLLIVFLQISIQLIAEACLPEGVSTCNPTSAGWVGIQHICSKYIQCLFLF